MQIFQSICPSVVIEISSGGEGGGGGTKKVKILKNKFSLRKNP